MAAPPVEGAHPHGDERGQRREGEAGGDQLPARAQPGDDGRRGERADADGRERDGVVDAEHARQDAVGDDALEQRVARDVEHGTGLMAGSVFGRVAGTTAGQRAAQTPA